MENLDFFSVFTALHLLMPAYFWMKQIHLDFKIDFVTLCIFIVCKFWLKEYFAKVLFLILAYMFVKATTFLFLDYTERFLFLFHDLAWELGT